jgi:hypothetical protein
MFTLAPRAIEDMVQSMRKGLLQAALPAFAEQAKNAVSTTLDELVSIEGQSVDNQVSSRYEITDRDATIVIEVILGPISGSYTANVTGSPKVADHSRSYEDTRPWEFPDGHWETVDHIPAAVAIHEGWGTLGSLGY